MPLAVGMVNRCLGRVTQRRKLRLRGADPLRRRLKQGGVARQRRGQPARVRRGKATCQPRDQRLLLAREGREPIMRTRAQRAVFSLETAIERPDIGASTAKHHSAPFESLAATR